MPTHEQRTKDAYAVWEASLNALDARGKRKMHQTITRAKANAKDVTTHRPGPKPTEAP